MNSYSQITGRYLKKQKKRTILAIIGIIMSVALITGVCTILASVQEYIIQEQIKASGEYHTYYTLVDDDQINKLRNHVDVGEVFVSSLIGESYLGKRDKRSNNQEGVHSPDSYYLELYAYEENFTEYLPIQIIEGREPKNSNEIVVNQNTLDEYWDGYSIGDEIILDITYREDEETGNIIASDWFSENEIVHLQQEDKKVTLVGVIEETGRYRAAKDRFIGSIGVDDNVIDSLETTAYIKLNNIKNGYEKSIQIGESIDITKDIYEVDSSNESYMQYHDELLRYYGEGRYENVNDTLYLLIAFVLAIIIICTISVIYNAFHISVMERISQFGVLRCVGASPQQIRGIVLREALMLSGIAIPIGLICGVFAMDIVFKVTDIIDTTGIGFGGIDVVVSKVAIILSAVLGLITVMLSAYLPARKASKVSALQAVRNTNEYKNKKSKKKKRKSLIYKLLGVEAEIAWKTNKRNKKKFYITVFSMVICIVLYIVFASFIDIINESSMVYYEESGDFQIYSATEEDYREMQTVEGIKDVYYSKQNQVDLVVDDDQISDRYKEIWKDYFEVNSKEGGNGLNLPQQNFIRGYELNEEIVESLGNILLEGTIDVEKMQNGNGVLISNEVLTYDSETNQRIKSEVLNINVGDKIKLKPQVYGEYEVIYDEDGQVIDEIYVEKEDDVEIFEVEVLGFVSGFPSDNNNYGYSFNIISSKEFFEDTFEDQNYGSIILNVESDVYLDNVREELNAMEVYYQDNVEAAKQMKEYNIIMSIFVYGFITIITLIGALNIVNTISTNIILRTRELAMLKAVGMTEFSMRKMITYEALHYSIIATIWGGVIGCGLNYILYGIIEGVIVLKWIIPLDKLAVVAIVATIIALISAYIPLKRINKGIIVEKIRLEE